MPGHWEEIIRLSFKGNRFRDHALDLTALAELSRFQGLIADTAKALWKGAHPSRERLPPHFEERTRLCVRNIVDGSATTPIEVYVEDATAPELFEREPFDDLTRAVDVVVRVYSAAKDDVQLPDEFPRQLLADYAKLGESLGDDAEIEIQPMGRRKGIKVTPTMRARLVARADAPYEDHVEITGEVIEADVRHQRFQMSIPAGYSVVVNFNETQEIDVTTALRDHRVVQLAVRGRGEYLPGGRLVRILRVDEHRIVPGQSTESAPSARSIEDELAEIACAVTPAAWDALPADLTDHLDHYLYGTPKE